jgi:uncharacterized membrane protein YfcA
MNQTLLASGAGLLGGVINAIAGGGSFVTFPALVFIGIVPVAANQTSSVALLPGSLASAWAYRSEIRSFRQVNLYVMAIPTIVGGGIGAVLLLITPTKAFDLIIPWLVLLGAITFAFGNKLRSVARSNATPINPFFISCYQLVLGAYGGYFGGAVGIMMMAGWMLFGVKGIRAMNGMKTFMLSATRVIAVAIFAFYGHVYWLIAVFMVIAAMIGGYLGAFLTRAISAENLRKTITVIFFIVTAAFFYRGYG